MKISFEMDFNDDAEIEILDLDSDSEEKFLSLILSFCNTFFDKED